MKLLPCQYNTERYTESGSLTCSSVFRSPNSSRKVVSEGNWSGSRKLSRLKSSSTEFCSGVPVNSTLCSYRTQCIISGVILCLTITECSSNMIFQSQDFHVGSYKGFLPFQYINLLLLPSRISCFNWFDCWLQHSWWLHHFFQNLHSAICLDSSIYENVVVHIQSACADVPTFTKSSLTRFMSLSPSRSLQLRFFSRWASSITTQRQWIFFSSGQSAIIISNVVITPWNLKLPDTEFPCKKVNKKTYYHSTLHQHMDMTDKS